MDEYRDEGMDGYGDADAELDQVAAAIRDGAPMLTMMFAELSRCGLNRDAAATVAVKWFVES